MQKYLNLKVLMQQICINFVLIRQTLNLTYMFRIRNAVVSCLLIVSFTTFSQIKNERWSITGELILPSGTLSKPYKNYLNGLVYARPTIQYRLPSNIFFGLAPRYSYYTIAEYKVPEKMTGGMHTIGGDLELGYVYKASEKWSIQFSSRFGYATQLYRTDSTRANQIKPSSSGLIVEPIVSFILASDEAVCYRWIFGYSFSNNAFSPEKLGMDNYGGFKTTDFRGPQQSILVGFGISYFFGNERSDTDLDEDWSE